MDPQAQAAASFSRRAPHFVVGLDVYERSDAPLEQAFGLALLIPGTKVDVIWAPPVLVTPLDGSVTPISQPQKLLHDRVKDAVAQFGSEKLIAAQAEVTLQIIDGRPAAVLSRAAFLSDADLIIVGAQDKGRLERLFVGSVSGKLVQEAPCPVLVARPKLKELPSKAEANDPGEPTSSGPQPRDSGDGRRYAGMAHNIQARESAPLLFPMQS